MSLKFTESILDLNYTRSGLLDKFEGIVPELVPKTMKDPSVTKYVYDPVSFQNGLQEGDKSLNMDRPENMYDYRPNLTWASKVKLKDDPEPGLYTKPLLDEVASELSGKITDEYVNKLDLSSHIVFIK